jgi:pre-rRNA-processing protein IPI3
LRTYLLEATPQALVLDPADRAVHAAYADGSIQTIDFFTADTATPASSTNTLYDPTHAHRPLQPPPRTRFNATSQNLGPALCLSLSWDGTTLISGHESGKIASWDVAKGAYSSTFGNLPGAVTNLSFLSPTGWPGFKERKFKIPAIVKPRVEGGSGDTVGIVPKGYTMNVQLIGRLRVPCISAAALESGSAGGSAFEVALTHPSFPDELLDEGLAELAALDGASQTTASKSADFVPLALAGEVKEDPNELEDLKDRFKKLQEIQKYTFKQIQDLRTEKKYWEDLEEKRARRKYRRQDRLQKNRMERDAVVPTLGDEREIVVDADESHSSDDELGDLDESSGHESDSDDD